MHIRTTYISEIYLKSKAWCCNVFGDGMYPDLFLDVSPVRQWEKLCSEFLGNNFGTLSTMLGSLYKEFFQHGPYGGFISRMFLFN